MPERHRGFPFPACGTCCNLVFWNHRGRPVLGFSLLLRYVLTGFTALALLAAVSAAPAVAAPKRHHAAAKSSSPKSRRAPMRMLASPTDPAKDAALVVDGATGKVLYA